MFPANLINIYYFEEDEDPARDFLGSLRKLEIPLVPKLCPLRPRKVLPRSAENEPAVVILGPKQTSRYSDRVIHSIAQVSSIMILAIGIPIGHKSPKTPAALGEVIEFSYHPQGVDELAHKVVHLLTARGDVPTVRPGEYDKALLSEPLRELGLPTHLIKRLEGAKINRVGDLVEHTEAEILRIPMVGRETLFLLRGRLARVGLRFGMDLPEWERVSSTGTSQELLVARLSQVEQEPLGAQFEPQSDILVIDHSGTKSDEDAARTQVVQQLHLEVTRKANDLYPVLLRLDNQVGWQGIAGACRRLTRALDRDTLALPSQLGALYSASLEMGSFLELNGRIHADRTATALPLDLEVQRPLEDLIRTAAPWLRSFSTIRELDDQAAQFSAPNPSVAPAGEVISRAAEASLVQTQDFEVLAGLVEAAGRGELQSSKASHRSVLSARNLVIVTGKVLAALAIGALGSSIATESVLVQRTGAFLASAEQPILEVISGLPSDVRLAVQALLDDNKRPTPTVPKKPAVPSQPWQQDRQRRKDDE